MKSYQQSTDEVLQAQKSRLSGLTSNEAGERLQKYGANKLAEAKKTTLLERFLQQLKDPMLIILLIAAAVSGVTSLMQNEGMADVIIILVVVLLNAVLGVYQENKAEAAIEALQTMTAATSKVLRDGKQLLVPSSQLVPGDIVVLEAGDSVPADGRIIEAATLKIEEAALTGESVPVNKMIDALGLDQKNDIPLGDRKNMCYMGSTVAYGRGKMVVTETGMQTEMGKIAGALSSTIDEQTPLQQKLASLGKTLSKIVLGICIFIFFFNLISAGRFDLDTVLSTFMVAVSLAVAAIPEGLATVVTVVLSIGVTKMSKQGAVIRKLTAVETLGCAQVICSDKTGTLTQNRMTVVEHYGDEEMLARTMAMCCDAQLGEDGLAIGEPTEAALVNYAASLGMKKNLMEQESPRIDEAPFDSSRKMMSTIHQTADGIVQYTKGAPDVILSRCTHYLENGEIHPMDDRKREEILSKNREMAGQALRVLAASLRRWEQRPESNQPEFLEQQLTFVGLTGMIDPVRPEVKPAIDLCRTAGIRPVMITGDHKDTAVAIARQLGIISGPQQAMTGSELDQMDDNELAENINRYGVYARVQPEHKVRIVNA